mgnify:CR=1 FL=1
MGLIAELWFVPAGYFSSNNLSSFSVEAQMANIERDCDFHDGIPVNSLGYVAFRDQLAQLGLARLMARSNPTPIAEATPTLGYLVTGAKWLRSQYLC